MKKVFFTLVIAFATLTASAQTTDEAINLIQTFYANTFKEEPILQLTSPSYGKVLKDCQIRSGYKGVKGTISYMFWHLWFEASSEELYDYSTEQGTVKATDATHANAYVNLTMKLSTYEGKTERVFEDKFMFVKVKGVWKIDDIIRNGESTKLHWKKYNISY